MLNIAGTQDEHFPRAAEYQPERWLRHHPLGPINHYASIPFSTGLRNCVGRRLSEQESYTVVARVSPGLMLFCQLEIIHFQVKLRSIFHILIIACHKQELIEFLLNISQIHLIFSCFTSTGWSGITETLIPS